MRPKANQQRDINPEATEVQRYEIGFKIQCPLGRPGSSPGSGTDSCHKD